MLVICILLSLFVCDDNPKSPICIEKDEYVYMDYSHRIYKVREYSIVNKSNDTPYITFIKLGDNNTNSDNVILRYFNSSHGEFNLMTLLTDNVVLVEFMPIIGETFLKEISPNSEFKYIVVEQLHDNNKLTVSDEDIFVFKKTYVEELIKIDLDDHILFPDDEIVMIL